MNKLISILTLFITLILTSGCTSSEKNADHPLIGTWESVKFHDATMAEKVKKVIMNFKRNNVLEGHVINLDHTKSEPTLANYKIKDDTLILQKEAESRIANFIITDDKLTVDDNGLKITFERKN
ncbi:hypothetical protein N9N13_08175 [Opitutales bacterium]|nr:hypothetical protein [Opitutales bacterium]